MQQRVGNKQHRKISNRLLLNLLKMEKGNLSNSNSKINNSPKAKVSHSNNSLLAKETSSNNQQGKVPLCSPKERTKMLLRYKITRDLL